MNLIERIKRKLFVLVIMYRKDIRKKVLKIVILLNCFLFFTAFISNLPSMILFLLNMFYIYNYLKKEYPEESLKVKDRFKVAEK